MTKEEMLKEIKFPVLLPYAINFISIDYMTPIENAWIICYAETKMGYMVAFYKWQKENNPLIKEWTYVDIESTTGSTRYIPYPHYQDEQLIIICDEKDKDLIIK